jgi:predicted nicotinamide N-methyase
MGKRGIFLLTSAVRSCDHDRPRHNDVTNRATTSAIATTMTDTESPQTSIQPFLHVYDTPIFFSEDWKTGIGGGLWSTGRMMARFFASDHARRMILNYSHNQELTVLELGSGNGLLSVCFMALAKNQIKHLVVTDMEDHLELIRQTIASNPLIVDATKPSNMIVVEHKWGVFEQIDDSDSLEARVKQARCQFDLILGSDVAYHPSLYKPLIASLQAYFHDKTVAIIGVTMLDTTIEFFDMLRSAGFCYERIADALIEPEEFRGTTFGLFIIRRQKPRILIQFRRSES